MLIASDACCATYSSAPALPESLASVDSISRSTARMLVGNASANSVTGVVDVGACVG